MDERFVKEEGLEVYTGNELLLKGALEAGVSLITGYPGSPVSEVFDAAGANSDLLKKHGVLAEMANNEALAVARLNGSRLAGVRAMAVMKSVGLHVASDGLALGNLSEPNNEGGSIVVVGDDPWIDSTQINNDSRYLSQHLHMPVLEPATFQELKDWVRTALDLSSSTNLYITYLVTTNQADGGGTVWAHPNQWPAVSVQSPVAIETAKINLDTNVLLPPRTWEREASLPSRFERLLSEARARGLNALIRPSASQGSPFGFITSGLAYCYLEHALADLGLSGRVPILKLGMTYPVDPQAVLEMAHSTENLYVIEEKRGFVEAQVIQILNDARQQNRLSQVPNVWGKKFPNGQAGIPESRGLNASLLIERLLLLLLTLPGLTDEERAQLRKEQVLLEATSHTIIPLPVRTPTFCPGCPHRDSSSVFLDIKKDFMSAEYMSRTHDRKPVDLVFHGETGCFTMLMFEPNKPLMHNYSGMGLGGGTGAGADPFITNKQIVFLGDSTFFHSGMIAVSDSIKSGQDITYVILDNKTTAMTGHQPTPGTELNIMGEKTFAQNIETIVAAMGGNGAVPVQRVNPEYRDEYRALLEETVLQDGVKIVIADKECGLTYHRRRKKELKAERRKNGFVAEEKRINVTPEVCEFCLECTKTTGCPGLTIEETLYGPKIVTDLTACVSDGACGKVKACPSFEEITIKRSHPPRKVAGDPALKARMDSLPAPAGNDAFKEDRFNIYTAGVGGMGAGLISAILVQAGHSQGYRVLFSDKRGLAIRNGSVFGHVIFSKTGGTLAPLVPYGKADLVLGIDLLEAARSTDGKQPLRVAHPERTAVVVNAAKNPTVRMLLGDDTADAEAWLSTLRAQSRPGACWSADISALCERHLGSTLYANLALLGASWQRGHLPLSQKHLEWAIGQNVPKEDRKANLEAFQLGRALVVWPEFFALPSESKTFSQFLDDKIHQLQRQTGLGVAREFRFLIEEAVLHLGLEEEIHKHLLVRAYDLVGYEDLDYARRYLDLVMSVFKKDRAAWNYRATRAVIRQTFKVMAIKDEVYVAHLLTRPEKYERDQARYGIDPANGDRVVYRHLNRPEFTVFGRRWRWDMDTSDWQLRIMSRLKFLRRLLPQWHAEERAFRDWYLDLAQRFEADQETVYDLWVKILELPEAVRGYREIRQPAMTEARRKAAELLTEIYRVIGPVFRRGRRVPQ